MASRGRGRRGRPRGAGQAPLTFDQPPIFDQQAFAEAVGIAAAAIAQASIASSQGGPSNLQRIRTHHPPTFIGGGDLMVADHWFMQIENILEAMEITSDATQIRLAAFQLEGEARVWLRWARASRDLEALTWAEFQELFIGKYFPETAKHAKAQEFLELRKRKRPTGRVDKNYSFLGDWIHVLTSIRSLFFHFLLPILTFFS